MEFEKFLKNGGHFCKTTYTFYSLERDLFQSELEIVFIIKI